MDHQSQTAERTTAFPFVSPLFFSGNIDHLQRVGRANLDAGVSAFTALAKSLCDWQSEVARFAGNRLDRNAEYARRLIDAKDSSESLSIQAEYLRTSVEDYTQGAQRLVECGVQASQEIISPVEKRAEAAASGVSQAATAVSQKVRETSRKFASVAS
jgi:hypothetical protein